MRLPVSGLDVSFRLPDGNDDLAILEAYGSTSGRVSSSVSIPRSEVQATVLERALDALQRLTTIEPSPPPSAPLARDGDRAPQSDRWANFTITDFESALLGLRHFLFGDIVRCILRCACAERMEIEFSIAHLLRESKPRVPSRVEPSTTRAGWFELRSKHARSDEHDQQASQITFRLPTVADQLLALRSPNPYGLLEHRCIEPSRPDGRAAIERAMESMTPAISRPIAGACAACGVSLNPQLHVPSLVLEELRASATGVHSEIHAIAATYHWNESAILAIPQLRRHAYTDAIRQAGAR
jgi:hypothetical protein